MAIPEALYINPAFEPYTNPEFNGMWIVIRSFRLKQLTADTPNDIKLITGDEGASWAFLAPLTINETINNSWEPWETVASRIAGKGVEFEQIVQNVAGLWRALSSQKKGIDVGVGFLNLSSIKKAKMKVDTPLVYENTDRREWNLEFKLIANSNTFAGQGGNTGEDMMEAVRTLQENSLPLDTSSFNIIGEEPEGLGLGIEFPYVFSLRSFPYIDENPELEIINAEYAVLTSVQPTFLAPYDKAGYPMRIDLTCTFKELPPLYANKFFIKEEA